MEKTKKEKWLESGKGLNKRMCLTEREKEEVIKRANYKCEICGKGGKEIRKELHLTVHHLHYPPLSYKDLQAVCDKCHREIPIKSNHAHRGSN